MKMYKWLSVLALIAVLLAACVPSTGAPATNTPAPAGATATPAGDGQQVPEAVTKAIAFLAAELGVEAETIQLVSHEAVDWSDSCLGAGGPAESCLTVITPGYRVMLQVGEENYELRTDAAGDQVRLVMAQTQPDSATQTPISQDEMPAPVVLARQALAQQLGVNQDEIEVASFEAVEWSDSCLGAGGPAESCLTVITPGYRVVLRTGGQNYQMHTNSDGSEVRQFGRAVVQEAPSDPVVAFAWHRSGGIAGFCDNLEVYQSGMAVASSCKGGESTMLGRYELTPAQRDQVVAWTRQFKNFELVDKDPAVADAMEMRVVFTGFGSQQPTEEQQREIALFAQDVFTNRPQ